MSRHELQPIPVPVELSEAIDKEGPAVEQVKAVNAAIVLANAALKEYGIEIIPAINLTEEDV